MFMNRKTAETEDRVLLTLNGSQNQFPWHYLFYHQGKYLVASFHLSEKW